MKGNRFLLDCTLRDGGYVNDWEFGYDNIINIFERLVTSEVDVIEIGFLDDRREFDLNRTIMPCTQDVRKIFGSLNKGDSMVVGMIDYGTCSLDNIEDCSESLLDGIRVIFKQQVASEALDYCREIKKKGYKVFAQLVSVTTYSDDDLKDLIEKVNDLQPYALSMVDTYGLLEPSKLTHIMTVIDKYLDKKIVLGFHAHNNFQLGFANAMTVLNSGFERDVLVDGTLYGMGKSAGNAPTELIAMYMNSNYEKNYSVEDLQEAISTSLMDIYRKTPWGYKLFFYIAALNKVHPDYVSFLMNKGTLSVTEINDLLQKIPEQDKLGKNIKGLEHIYLEYQKNECDDANTIKDLNSEYVDKNILILGPGRTIREKEMDITDYIDKYNPIVISINYIPDNYKLDYVFVSNSQRYLMMASKLVEAKNKKLKIIATSNVTRMEEKLTSFDYRVNYSKLIDEENEECPDNSLLMLLTLLIKIGVKQVAIAGCDGYTPDDVNYVQENMEYTFIKRIADKLNQDVKKYIFDFKNQIGVKFITPSKYERKNEVFKYES